jgi:hypothetical protein
VQRNVGWMIAGRRHRVFGRDGNPMHCGMDVDAGAPMIRRTSRRPPVTAYSASAARTFPLPKPAPFAFETERVTKGKTVWRAPVLPGG